jgi:hypothetical protein
MSRSIPANISIPVPGAFPITIRASCIM